MTSVPVPRPLTVAERALLPGALAAHWDTLWHAYAAAETARADAIDRCDDLVAALTSVVTAVAPTVAAGTAAEKDLRSARGADLRRAARALDPEDVPAVRALVSEATDLADTMDTLAAHHEAVGALVDGASSALDDALNALPPEDYREAMNRLLPDLPPPLLLHWLRLSHVDGPDAFAASVFQRAGRTLGMYPLSEVTAILVGALTRPTWGPVAWRVAVARWLIARRPAEALAALRRAPLVVAALTPDDLALALHSSIPAVRTDALLLMGGTTDAPTHLPSAAPTTSPANTVSPVTRGGR